VAIATVLVVLMLVELALLLLTTMRSASRRGAIDRSVACRAGRKPCCDQGTVASFTIASAIPLTTPLALAARCNAERKRNTAAGAEYAALGVAARDGAASGVLTGSAGLPP
jgi:hypothetical protein